MKRVLIGPILFALSLDLKAQPINDNRVDAILLNHTASWVSADAEFTNINATGAGFNSPWGGYHNVWFKFVATTNEVEIRVETGGSKGTLQKSKIVLFNETGTVLASLAMPGFNTNYIHYLNLITGNTYYFYVDDDAGIPGSFTLRLNNQVGFDMREKAAILSHVPFWTSGDAGFSNVGATGAGFNSPWGGYHNVWFKFVATTNEVEIRVETGGSKGTLQKSKIVLFNETGTVLASLAMPGFNTNYIHYLNLITGNTYYFYVDDDAGIPGSFTLRLNNQVGFDMREKAAILSHVPFWTSGDAGFSNVGATGAGFNSPWGGYHNVWFKFVATTNEVEIRVETGGSKGTLQKSKIVLFNETGTVLASLAMPGFNTNYIHYLNLITGNTYYFYVDDDAGIPGSFTLRLNNQVGFDMREKAAILSHVPFWTSGDAGFSNVGATGAGFNSPWGGYHNVWFKFVATTNEVEIRVETGGSKGTLQKSKIVLFNEIGTVLASLAMPDFNTNFIHYLNLTLGNTYYFYVDDDAGFPGTFTLTVEGGLEEVSSLQSILENWSFQYRYDARNRMIMKKVPGAEPVFMVYDNRDRLVLTQDGNQRLAHQWMFTKYDQLNRPIMTGIYTHGIPASQEQMNNLISTTKFFDTYDGSANHGYTNTVFPTTGLDVLTVTYYDNYDFKSLWGGANYNYVNDNLTATVINGTYNQPATEFLRATGQVTGSKTRVLGTPTYLNSVTYYDDRYRVIQSVIDNYRGGAITGTDRTSNLYDFPGKVIKTKTSHSVGTTEEVAVTRRLMYDHGGRLLKTYHQVGTQNEVLLSQNEYNELGQLVDKNLHSENDGDTFKQSVDYRYNIRGWLTRMNDSDVMSVANQNEDQNTTYPDLFGMNLLYEQNDANLGNTGQFNGNVSAMKWSANQGQSLEKERGYAFSYDALNRLLSASHKVKLAGWSPSPSYHEDGFSYDLNGNILTLNRKGALGSNMDQLGYTYSGNQLLTVTDAGDQAKGFVEPASTTGDDYDYDDNGNMYKDQNKGIFNISYNHLNLPIQVVKDAGKYVMYTYDATGCKLRQEVYESGILQKSTDYAGEFIYENSTLQFINHEEGRIIPEGNQYQYHLKDHLGNVRVTFTTKLEVEENTGTYEPENAIEEQTEFLRYDNAKLVNSTLFDKTNGASTGYAERLNGTANEKFGLAKSISVMPGDTINVEVYAKYVDTNSANWTAALNSLMSQIGSGEPGVVVDGANYTSSTASFPFAGLLDTGGSSSNGPKAYLNWLVFDREYNLQLNGTGYMRMSDAAKEFGQDVAHERLYSPEIIIKEPGYVYVYLSNEEPEASPIEVYFDDFSVTHTKSPVIESQDFYPFGLRYNSYSRENSVPNKMKLFQGQEHIDDLGLNWDSFKWRNHQPDIGRFFNIDPIAEKYYYNSPYAFSENKVVAHVELEGLESSPFMNAKIVSDNQAYRDRVVKSGNQEAIKQMRKEEAIGAIIGLGMFLGPVATILLPSTASTGLVAGSTLSGGTEAALNPEATGSSIVTKTVAGGVGGALLGGGNTMAEGMFTTTTGKFFGEFATGMVSSAVEETTNQVLEKATQQRDEVNTAQIVETSLVGGLANSIGGRVLSWLGLSNPSTPARVVTKNAAETAIKVVEGKAQEALDNDKKKK